MTEFKTCHEGASREPLETACRAEFARMKADTERALREAGQPVTGDANRDAEALMNFEKAQSDAAWEETKRNARAAGLVVPD